MAAYWPSGALNTLNSLLCNLPAWKYSLDGEGRAYSVSASSGQAPVISTFYNSFTEPTSVSYGSLDSENFGYDPNTGRMTQYLAAVNGVAQIGALSWNANGTLSQLAINDSLNSTNTQTCGYTHDDLIRLGQVNCGSKWSQTFNPRCLRQHFQDRLNQLAADLLGVDQSLCHVSRGGNMASIDTSTSVVYDAFDRRVEENGGASTEILYGPSGTKLATVSGQTVNKFFLPLPGGGTAVYTSSGLAYYRHADWLGSNRVSSTPSRTLYYDGAYAPFGESYAETGTTDHSFTGQNEDLVPDLYNFPYRDYHATQGRWIQPDPAGLAAVDPTNPQTWNRYGYVGNNPLAYVDPFGTQFTQVGIVTCSGNSSSITYATVTGGYTDLPIEVNCVLTSELQWNPDPNPGAPNPPTQSGGGGGCRRLIPKQRGLELL